MKRRTVLLLLLLLPLLCYDLYAQESLRTIILPKPDTVGGKPLMQALKERRTSRSFSDTKITDQVLSNLLWAAFGVNRPDGHRTAPSAMNWQEIDIYVATADGLFLFDAKTHSLKPLVEQDIRSQTGGQDFVGQAPVNLVYVADLRRVNVMSTDETNLYTAADCGFIAQNVYLYCASEGLSVVVRGSINRQELANVMNLHPKQRIILAQTVGYPK